MNKLLIAVKIEGNNKIDIFLKLKRLLQRIESDTLRHMDDQKAPIAEFTGTIGKEEDVLGGFVNKEEDILNPKYWDLFSKEKQTYSRERVKELATQLFKKYYPWDKLNGQYEEEQVWQELETWLTLKLL